MIRKGSIEIKPKQFKQETQSGQTKLNDTPLLIDLNCSVGRRRITTKLV
jgi:hypothetical protein